MVRPDRHAGTRLGNHVFVSSTLITILTGLLLQLTHIIDFVERIDSWPWSVTVRLLDVGFRMTMGALLIFLLVPLLFGYWRQAPWLKRYLRYMRVSLGTSPRKTVSATILSLIALVLIMIGFSLGSGVFDPDLGVLVADDQWIILFLALVPGIWEELAFRGVILSNLQQRFSPWAAVVISSHLLSLVEDLSSHLLILHRGESLYFGPVEEARAAFGDLHRDATLEEVFLRATES